MNEEIKRLTTVNVASDRGNIFIPEILIGIEARSLNSLKHFLYDSDLGIHSLV